MSAKTRQITCDFSLAARRTCLLVVDLQRGFCKRAVSDKAWALAA